MDVGKDGGEDRRALVATVACHVVTATQSC